MKTEVYLLKLACFTNITKKFSQINRFFLLENDTAI